VLLTKLEDMNLVPYRLSPGTDLRSHLDSLALPSGESSGFVVSGLGSLQDARIRLAASNTEFIVNGPSELLSISGSLSAGGCHVHVAIATSTGQVVGGHLCYGSKVRTTVELLVAPTPGFSLSRALDAETGYQELVITPATGRGHGAA
jgi:uncharacterized protein